MLGAYRNAEQKNANSHELFEVAMRTKLGLGVAMSPSTALVWYRRAADKGCPHARKYVEIWNELGRRTDVLRDIHIAADRDSAIGLFLRGWTKWCGLLAAEDVPGSQHDLRRASDAGLAAAQYGSAIALRYGNGVAVDEKAAFQDEEGR
jgi:TPR repeat protein